MMQIKNKKTGKVLLEVPGDTLERANLSDVNLSDANLIGANLYGANLRYANLRYANLSVADLRYANLRYANLSGADLSVADLSDANLSGADLRYANLSDANLSGADFSDVYLSDANLSGADLSDVYLRGANGIDLSSIPQKEETSIGLIKQDFIDVAVGNILSFSDEQLRKLISVLECIIAYFEVRGDCDMILNPLRSELTVYRGMMEARKES